MLRTSNQVEVYLDMKNIFGCNKGIGIECVICKDNVLNGTARGQAVTLKCGHVFHESCIQTWLCTPRNNNRQHTCPECRSIANNNDIKKLFFNIIHNEEPNGNDNGFVQDQGQNLGKCTGQSECIINANVANYSHIDLTKACVDNSKTCSDNSKRLEELQLAVNQNLLQVKFLREQIRTYDDEIVELRREIEEGEEQEEDLRVELVEKEQQILQLKESVKVAQREKHKADEEKRAANQVRYALYDNMNTNVSTVILQVRMLTMYIVY